MVNIKLALAFALAGAMGVCAGCARDPASAEAATSAGLMSKILARGSSITVPAGTPVIVRLEHSISSATAQPGDTFVFTLAEPVVVDGRTVAVAGARGMGRVVSARKSGRLHNAGYVRIAMTSIEVDGNQVPLQSSSIFVTGGRYAKRNAAFIGGSAGAGALIGALTGGGKGAAIGASIGASAGTGAAYATGKKEAGFNAERTLTFKIMQPLTV